MQKGMDNKEPTDRSGDRAREPRGNEDLRFLDLELAEALHGEATRIAREAYLRLLRRRIEEKLAERLAEQIDALAALAAEDLAADLEANLDIERRIKERALLREEHANRLKALFGIPGTSNDTDG